MKIPASAILVANPLKLGEANPGSYRWHAVTSVQPPPAHGNSVGAGAIVHGEHLDRTIVIRPVPDRPVPDRPVSQFLHEGTPHRPEVRHRADRDAARVSQWLSRGLVLVITDGDRLATVRVFCVWHPVDVRRADSRTPDTVPAAQPLVPPA